MATETKSYMAASDMQTPIKIINKSFRVKTANFLFKVTEDDGKELQTSALYFDRANVS